MINSVATLLTRNPLPDVLREGLVAVQNLCVWEEGAAFVLKSEIVHDALLFLWARYRNRKMCGVKENEDEEEDPRDVQHTIQGIFEALRFAALKSGAEYPAERFSDVLGGGKRYCLVEE